MPGNPALNDMQRKSQLEIYLRSSPAITSKTDYPSMK